MIKCFGKTEILSGDMIRVWYIIFNLLISNLISIEIIIAINSINASTMIIAVSMFRGLEFPQIYNYYFD